jgi:bifunctional non-homologous end joining protein LigD
MKQSLDTYAKKRKFTRTPEPAPKVHLDRRGPLLFVIQKHAARRLHYDFRLELDGVLKSWAVPKGPSLDPKEKRLAVPTEDHPFDYASFEGVIPAKEYGGGNVIVWDCGVYSPDEGQRYGFHDRDEAQARLREEIANGKLSVFLRGHKLKGSFALVRTSGEDQWLLIKHKDRFVAGSSDVLARSESVLSGTTVETIGNQTLDRIDARLLVPSAPIESLPRVLKPMLADAGEGAVQSDAQWLYEPKLDGYRVIARCESGSVRLTSRNGLDMTRAFPEVAAALEQQAVDSMIIDGELIALDPEGRPSFNALQNRAKLKTAAEIAKAQSERPVAMVCFDLLHFAGVNLRESTYMDRRRYLAQCVLPSERLQIMHASEDAQALYDAALHGGFEGIVAKRKDSQYLAGRRSAAWLKFKSTRTEEFIVGGYTKGKGARETIGALLLGTLRADGSGKLQYVGHAGSGLNERVIATLLERLEPLHLKRSAFDKKPDLHRPTTWVAPGVVVEVTYQERTPDGLLRAPVFKRIRDDLNAIEVTSPRSKTNSKALATPHDEISEVLQQLNGKGQQLDLAIGAARIRVTNLDRVYWPADPVTKAQAITKRDHLKYLAGVSPYMLPHLRDRPLTMIRMPGGIDGERFFQKHWEQSLPEFVETITVFSEHKDDHHDYLLGNNLATLLWLGQVGTLEFHIWHSRASLGADAISRQTDYSTSASSLEASVLNFPDYLVFDIDPYIYSGKEAKGAEPELNRKGFTMGRKVAFWIHELLQQMALRAIVKTSGKTGLHVFVPIERTVNFDEARHICEMVGRHVMKAHPKDITMEWAVIKRTGKIFIDYNMNVRGKTLNVAYSPRGVPGAPISMPLTWEELEAAEPLDFTMQNVLARLERTGDRWQDALLSKQSLAKAFGSVG